MPFSIEGKTAIVTGAANGVGLAIARQFLEAGARVMFADIDEQGLTDELGPMREDDASPARFFAGDLREKLTQTNLLAATIDAFERVDILVNASRKMVLTDPFDLDDDSVDAALNHNLLPSLRLSQLVAKRMIRQSDEDSEGVIGSIVNLSSITAQRTRAELMGYSIAMAALDQATRSMALVYAPHRIRVNAVAFGSVMSASLQDSLRENSAYRENIIAGTPLERIANASEVADAVQYLAADGSSFVTGQIITVDGGRSLVDVVSAPAH